MVRGLFAGRVVLAVAVCFFLSFPAPAYPEDGIRKLTIKDCVSMALEKNTSLMIARERKNYAGNRRKEQGNRIKIKTQNKTQRQ